MPAAAAMRSSIKRTVGSCPLLRNIPALVRIVDTCEPLPLSPTTVLGASCFFASVMRCSHSWVVRKLRNMYALGPCALSTSGGDAGKPGSADSWFSLPYSDLGSGAVDLRKASSGSSEAIPRSGRVTTGADRVASLVDTLVPSMGADPPLIFAILSATLRSPSSAAALSAPPARTTSFTAPTTPILRGTPGSPGLASPFIFRDAISAATRSSTWCLIMDSTST
jgi:hypothetical protein